MCCFNNNNYNNCCDNNRLVVRRVYITGPQGPRGPVGPQGIQGEPGVTATADSIFATATGTVTAGSQVPLTAEVTLPDTAITITDGSITLPAGYYLVNYGYTADTVTDATLNLLLNGTVIDSVTSSGGTTYVTGNRTVIVNATDSSVLSVDNGGTTNLTNGDFFVTVVKLA